MAQAVKHLICWFLDHKWEHCKGENEDGSLAWDYDVCKRCGSILVNNAVVYSYGCQVYPPVKIAIGNERVE